MIDLAVLYPAKGLSRAKAVLSALGFGRQSGEDPFPESRPMRTASVQYEGRAFPVHAHVVAVGGKEAMELLQFRELLRGSEELRQKYEAIKRSILRSGVTDGLAYSRAKGSFIKAVLAAREIP